MTVVMAVLLLMLAVLGCSPSTSVPSNTAAPTENKLEPAKPPVKIAVELMDYGNIPPSEGTYDNNRWTKWIKQEALKFGVDVEFFIVPRSEEVSKIHVLMASGSAPDLIHTYDRNVFLNYAKMGGLKDLTPLMDKSGSNIKKDFGAEFLKYGQIDGKQYAIPARRSSFALNGYFIRQDWLDKLKLPMPETIDQFYTTLKAFKERASELGTKDVIPLGVDASTGATGFSTLTAIYEAFIKTPTEEEIAAVPLFLREGFLDGLKFVNKLYQEGLMNREFGLDNNMQKFKEHYMNNQIGFVGGHSAVPWLTFNTQAVRKAIPDINMVGFKGIKNKSNEFVMQQGLPIGLYNMIPATSKNPEAALKYLDWLIHEGSFALWFGLEGEHYKMVNGKMEIINAEHNATTLEWMRAASATTYNMTAHHDLEQQKQLLTQRFSGADGVSYLNGIKLFEQVGKKSYVFESVPEMQLKHGTALKKMADNAITKMIMLPPGSVEAEYKKFVDEYMKTGGKEVIDEAKRLFKEMKK
jgi:putative aldouronate transport system substrate-binding protein